MLKLWLTWRIVENGKEISDGIGIEFDFDECSNASCNKEKLVSTASADTVIKGAEA